jgi:dipeptidyl aminopeptidase/acylaminoacyl peptidase
MLMRTRQIRSATTSAIVTACLIAIVSLERPAAGQGAAVESITHPVVSEDTSPVETISPVAEDGYRGHGLLRKPPGAGPFPAVVIIHGGLTTQSPERVRELALGVQPSRFLAAGYAVAVITYRSRDHDPQSPVSAADAVAAVAYVRKHPSVDPDSVVVSGCSGGGDLALEVAAATDIAAIVPEEPASILLTGVFNKTFAKQGERYTPADSAPIYPDPKRYYTAEYQDRTRAKLARIRCPILIIQGDQQPLNRFNAAVLIPELRAAGKTLEVITYPGEPHCFAFYGRGARTPRPAVAYKAFLDSDRFMRRYIRTQPKPIESRLVKQLPIGSS